MSVEVGGDDSGGEGRRYGIMQQLVELRAVQAASFWLALSEPIYCIRFK
ncbi:578_t:CDS:2 [Diversispora eburnea]|uniref:578_t:CDS:1 n=1 Tax=Diversispora eburnea TaxID=1213867 RepID=A0A9N8W9Y8_9GLOM|nr:578_t:CDS:2 [Diversispora eburnea]